MNKTKVCVCGAVIVQPANQRGGEWERRKFCTRKCAANNRTDEHKERLTASRRDVTIPEFKTCQMCLKQFARRRQDYPSVWPSRRFCSNECRTAANRGKTWPDSVKEKQSQSRSELPEWARKPMLGKTQTEESKAKMSIAQMGKKLSLEHRRNMSLARKGATASPEARRNMSAGARRGADSPMWRGGISENNENLRKTLEYGIWRDEVKKRDDWTCQMCGQRGGELHSDHIMPFALYPDLRLELTNGQTLCAPCHRNTPTWGHRTRKLAEAV